MRTSVKVISALSVAGLAVAAGSAFTATSEIDKSAKIVGAASQSISGLHIDTVQYTVGANDTTTGVKFHVTEDLVATPATVKATITGTASATETATCTQAVNAVAGTDLTCTFTGVAGVITLNIVAS